MLWHAAAGQYRFDSWTTDNGLPQNGTRGIAQTPDGYLWITTFDGLVRFDGAKFTVFDKNNTPEMTSNRYSLLFVDNDGTLYAGTEENEILVYRNGQFKSYTKQHDLPFKTDLDFERDVNGNFFLASETGNFHVRDGRFFPAEPLEVPNGRQFLAGASGNLWLYNADGIRQHLKDGREIFYPIKFKLYNNYFSGLKLFEDGSGQLWCSDLNGVYALKDGVIKKFTTADGVPPGMTLRPYLQDSDGSIWFASAVPWQQGVGLVRFKDDKFTTWGKEAGLSSLFVANLFKDREGTIWVTTDRGLDRLQKQFIRSYSTADGLIFPEVYPMLQSRTGDIFVGTMQGLSRFHDGRFSEVVSRDPHGDIMLVQALYEDDRGRLWIGVIGDLYLFDNGKLTEIPGFFHITPAAIHQDRNGNIWVGAGGGLFKFQNDRLVAKYTPADGLPSDDIKAIQEDRNGTLWIGTYGGLARFDGTRFTPLTSRDGLASDRIRTIYEDQNGVIWIGTYDGGLSRYADGKFFNFTIANGLYNNGVFQIMEDAHANFWISCNKGIYRVNRHELEAVAAGETDRVNSIAYGKQDGMLNTECNGGRQPAGVTTADGKFWFPTQEGVVVVDPNEVTFNPQPPPVQIEQVIVERLPVNFASGITLQANRDNLEIRFTGISFIKPDQVKFRYRIEGLSDNWTEVGTIREVYFPSLPAGEYTFHVIAANADGVWNNEGAYLTIHVRAPFWRRTWFIVVLAFALVALTIVVFRLRELGLRRSQRLQQEFSRRVLESQEQERKRIASEMHDSLGQYLLAIKNWAMFGLNSLPLANPAREHLDEISEASTLAIAEVREIAHNLRPYQLERLGLTNTLEQMLSSTKLSTAIEVDSQIENIDGVLSPDAEIVFYRIVQECLNNVLKHSSAANAWFSVELGDGAVEFRCRDNGKGFDVDAASNSTQSGLGLNGIAERVRILGGTIQIHSELGVGTTTIILIPRPPQPEPTKTSWPNDDHRHK